MNEPWRDWTPERLKSQADSMAECGHHNAARALEDFAAILEAEQKGERCVLPPKVKGEEMDAMTGFDGAWRAWRVETYHPEGQGPTQESAILDLARKLRNEK